MIHIRTDREIELLRQCGRMNADVHKLVGQRIEPGISAQELSEVAISRMQACGAKSSLRDYHGFPADICISINDEVGHGIPGPYVIQSGDVVKVDISIEYEGYHTDCAITHVVGEVSEKAMGLVDLTRQSLYSGISQARSGNRCSDISAAINRMVQAFGYSTIRHAFGHGIGTDLHESPFIANFGPANRGPVLRPGMVIAIEPVTSLGARFTYKRSDGWTDATVDKSISAHFEHTILITNGEPEILTQHQEEIRSVHEVGREMPLQYRKMTEQDRTRVFDLVAQEMDPILIEAWGRRADPQDIFAPDIQMIVIQDDSKRVIGFYGYCEVEGELHLNTIVVDSRVQGAGIGRNVMKQLEDVARQNQLPGLRLNVQTNNHRAIGFYRKLGFISCGTPYVNTILMRKLI